MATASCVGLRMPRFVYFSPLTRRFNRADGFCGDKINLF